MDFFFLKLKSSGGSLFFSPVGIIWLFFECFILRLEAPGSPLAFCHWLNALDGPLTFLLGCSHLLDLSTIFTLIAVGVPLNFFLRLASAKTAGVTWSPFDIFSGLNNLMALFN